MKDKQEAEKSAFTNNNLTTSAYLASSVGTWLNKAKDQATVAKAKLQTVSNSTLVL